MKKIFTAKNLLFIVASMLSLQETISQPVVYLDFVTHNEETSLWYGSVYYTNNRAKLITLGNYFQTNGITWNMQSDWRYLTNVITQETSALMATTNNKSILMWLQDDKGVEMDPHAHESQYIYPDVVYLMDSIGLTESKLIGGSIYNDSNGINLWTNLINGQYGIIFPNKFWQPDYMMGGGTPNHVNDLDYYGFWNPQSTTSYLTHDTTNHLRHIGVGCSIKIKDTSDVVNVVADLHDVIQKVQSGQYPSTGFYVQTIFFEQGDLNNLSFYNKVIQVADSANAIVVTGAAQWKTLKQAYTLWENVYNHQMFQWECGQIATGTNDIVPGKIKVYPNPATNKIIVKLDETAAKDSEFKMYNIHGEVLQQKISNSTSEIDVSRFPSGIYFYRLTNNQQIISASPLVIQ